MYSRSSSRNVVSQHVTGRSSQSEGWQDWNICTQDSQTPGLPSNSLKRQHQTPYSSGGCQMGGNSQPTEGMPLQLPFSPGGTMNSLVFARDVRFGMHTILSVLRDLPEQLQNISLAVTSGQDVAITKQMQELMDPLLSEINTLKALLKNVLAEITKSTKSNERDLLDTIEKRDMKITDLEERLRVQEAKTQNDRKHLMDNLFSNMTEVCEDVKKAMGNIDEVHRLQKETKEMMDSFQIIFSSLDTQKTQLRSKLELLCDFSTQVEIVATAAQEQKLVQENAAKELTQVLRVVEQMGSQMASFTAKMETNVAKGRVEVSPVAEVRPNIKPSKDSKVGQNSYSGNLYSKPSMLLSSFQKQNHLHNQQQQYAQENQQYHSEHQPQLQQSCQKIFQNQQMDQQHCKTQNLEHLNQNEPHLSQTKASGHHKNYLQRQVNFCNRIQIDKERKHVEYHGKEIQRLPEAAVQTLQKTEVERQVESKQNFFEIICDGSSSEEDFSRPAVWVNKKLCFGQKCELMPLPKPYSVIATPSLKSQRKLKTEKIVRVSSFKEVAPRIRYTPNKLRKNSTHSILSPFISHGNFINIQNEI
ncbi:uncharacterized protein LOC143038873 isoform X2 [Oratosquilla oratoria]|uniref:uncharacterized protein LOC143038873 isoform X2 n=1 Tax=Oratosquilla oratoria TaxID=337810 RepID=UPI003F767353